MSGPLKSPLVMFPTLLLIFFNTVYAMKTGGNCPEAVAGVANCKCEVWLSGLKIVCTGAVFKELTRTLVTADLPISSLRMRNTVGLEGKLPKNAFGPVLIKELDLSENDLSAISAEALKGQESSLRLLLLANNSISTLPDLRAFSKMETLDATSNVISVLADILPPALSQLRLKRNRICTLAPTSLGLSKSTLIVLDLSENCFRTFPTVTLREAPKLGYLDLSRNELTAELGFQHVVDLPALRELRLSENPITNINVRAFSGLPSLEHLSLRETGLRRLSRGVLDATTFPALSILDLTRNQLGLLESGVLEGLRSLRQVLLDGNALERIDTGAIAGNPKLQLLSLQENQISSIADAAFQDLPALLILLLSNNSLSSVGAATLGDLPGLQQLSLKGNDIEIVDKNAFSGLPLLTTVDASRNRINRIQVGTLDALAKLNWLDLTDNRISFFEEGSLPRRIPNLILTGNPLNCEGEPITYLMKYLASNNVRTTMPNNPPLTCAVPAKYAGLDFKQLGARRANETFFKGIDKLIPGGFNPGGAGSNQLPLANLLPSLDRIPGLQPVGIPGLNAPIPGLNTLTRAIPALADLPGVNALVNPSIRSPGEPDELLRTFNDFTRPLSKFVVGQKPTANDVQQIIGSLPKLAKQLPSVASIDVSKYSPETIRAFLRGEDIPGIPISKAARETLTRRILSQMARAAEVANRGGTVLPDGTRIEQLLPPPSSLPAETVRSVLKGERLPTLSSLETAAVREYYTQRILHDTKSATTPDPLEKTAPTETAPVVTSTELPVDELLGVLGQDLSLVPDSIITSIARGEKLNFADVPQELIDVIQKKDPDLARRIEDIINEQNGGAPKKNAADEKVAVAPADRERTVERQPKLVAEDPVIRVRETVRRRRPQVTASPVPTGRGLVHPDVGNPSAGLQASDTFDINDLRVELVDPSAVEDPNILLFSLIGTTVVALFTGLAIAFLCWRKAVAEKKKNANFFRAPNGSIDEIMTDQDDLRPVTPIMNTASPFYTGWNGPQPPMEDQESAQWHADDNVSQAASHAQWRLDAEASYAASHGPWRHESNLSPDAAHAPRRPDADHSRAASHALSVAHFDDGEMPRIIVH